MNLSHYNLLAQLFVYPEKGFFERTKDLVDFLEIRYPLAAQDARLFYSRVSSGDIDSAQELYTRSFDVQAVTTLDVGYVLFGEDHRRGEILANLNREHLKASNDCGLELADHLPNLLRLLAKSDDRELVRDLALQMIIRALLRMISEFDSAKQEERNKLHKKYYKTVIDFSETNFVAYSYALKALLSVLKQDFQEE